MTDKICKASIKYDECNYMKYELNTCLCMLPWIALQSKALAPFLNIWFIVVLSLAVHGLIIIQQDNVIWNMFQAEHLLFIYYDSVYELTLVRKNFLASYQEPCNLVCYWTWNMHQMAYANAFCHTLNTKNMHYMQIFIFQQSLYSSLW